MTSGSSSTSAPPTPLGDASPSVRGLTTELLGAPAEQVLARVAWSATLDAEEPAEAFFAQFGD